MVRCILYPGTIICVASKSRKQAIEVIDKIETLLKPNSENLRNEIKETINNQAIAFVSFHNSSIIKIITANDNARHNRANILVVDEFRMVDIEIINKVLRKFLIGSRQPKYLSKDEYKHLSERNKEFYMSSAWFRSHWSFEKLKAYTANLIDDTRKYFVCGLPYQLAIKENLLMADAVEDEMSESDFSEIGWSMEMETLWFSDDDGTFYSYEDISKTRKIKYPMLPSVIADKISDKRIRIAPRLVEGERRVLSADIALMSSKYRNNDASSLFINQILPTGNGDRYMHNIIYTENHEGLLTDQLALIIRRLFHEFECTDLVIDSKNVGFGVFEALLKDIYDSETGETYGALSCCNNTELAERCLVPDAPKVIWAFNNQTPKFNSDCAVGLREMLRQGRVKLLISEFSADEELSDLKGYTGLSLEDRLKFQMPYVHTGLLVNELINLSYEEKSGVIRVKEKAGERKDRYSSLSYNIYVSRQVEEQMKKPKNEFDPAQMLSHGKKARLYSRLYKR